MSSFLLARLPSHSKSLEAVDFMVKNHFSYRISSNFGRFFNSILGDSRLPAAMDFNGEFDHGFEEKRLIQQLTNIFDAVEVKEEDPDDDDRLQKMMVDPKEKVKIAEQFVEKVKQEDLDDQSLEMSLATLKNDGVDEHQDKEIKEEEPDDYEERIRSVKPRTMPLTDETENLDEQRGEGDPEIKEEPIDTDFTMENAVPIEAPVEYANGGRIEEEYLNDHDVGAEQQEEHGQNKGLGEQVDFPMESVDDFDEEEEELIEEQEYEKNNKEEDAEVDAEFENEDEEEEESDDSQDDDDDYSQEDSDYEEDEENEGNGGNPADEGVQKGKKDGSQRKDASREEIKRLSVTFRLLYTCPIKDCPSSYNSFEELKEHMKSHSDKENFACDICRKEFSSLFVAMDHIRKRKEKKCCQCGKKAADVAKMLDHHRVHTGERPFICGQCKKQFAQKGHLKSHEMAHSGMKPFECSECNRRFARRTQLTRHLRSHTGSKSFECGQCKKRFAHKDSLKVHERAHAGIKRHECSLCNAKFVGSSDLTRHLRIHTGDKPYECGECKTRFTQLAHLKKHEMTHSGVKPFKCTVCGRGFIQKDALITHQRTHTGEKPFACKECDQKFMSKDAVRKHMKRKHK